MSEMIRLENRSVIEIKGPDAPDFLQGILSNDVNQTEDNNAIYTGLLTPQGKLLFDFFVVKSNDTYLLDVEKGESANLVKRLMFYKLRADVQITALESAVICASLEGDMTAVEDAISYTDPRFDKIGARLIILQPEGETCTPNPDKWLAHRISLGLPEVGADYAFGNCFPHDIAMDQLNGIGFKKGCYVGQEVVSRMQHRGTARKRPMIVQADEKLPVAPIKIEAEGSVIGTLGSACGNMGLAEIRIDKAGKALDGGKAFDVGGIAVKLLKPEWAKYGEEFDTVGE